MDIDGTSSTGPTHGLPPTPVLTDMTRPELEARAAEVGLDGRAYRSKGALLEAIQRAQAAESTPAAPAAVAPPAGERKLRPTPSHRGERAPITDPAWKGLTPEQVDVALELARTRFGHLQISPSQALADGAAFVRAAVANGLL
jgi:hypothetical protein